MIVDNIIENPAQFHEMIIERKPHESHELQQEVLPQALDEGRSSKSSLSKLPVELVVEILLHYHYIALPSHAGQPYRGRAYDRRDRKRRHQWWLSLTSICRHWRTIALQTPLLWSTLDPSICLEPYALETFLARSADRLVHVSLYHEGWIKEIDNALVEIFRISERVRVLCFTLNSPKPENNDVCTVVKESTDAPFLSLECLYMNGIFDTNFAFDLLYQIFPTAQKLRILTLQYFTVGWDHFMPHLSQTMTNLSLVYMYDEWHDIFDDLSNLRSLESLTIAGGWQPRPRSWQADLVQWEKKIIFPNLRYLDISGQNLVVMLLLGGMSCSPSSRLKLCITLPGNIPDVAEECNICNDVFSHITLPCETFTASLSLPCTIDLSFDTLPHKPLFTITFERPGWPPLPSYESYAHLFRQVPNIISNLTDIVVPSRLDLVHLFHIQSKRNYDNGDYVMHSANNDTIIFPQLNCVRIENVEFQGKTVRDQLSEFLETWDKLGCRVPLLSLTGCSIPGMSETIERSEGFKKWLGDKVDILELDGIVL